MKVLLAAVNAKYIHSNLGIYSLKAYGEKMLAEQGFKENRYRSSWRSIPSTTS